RSLKRIVDNLDIIISEGNRLTRLINDVLDVAKMESGKIEWHMVDVNIAEVIRRAVSATAALAAEKDLPVEVILPQELPNVYADQDRLIQVITNLLSNAIKFTEDGEIQVRAFLTQVLPDATIKPYIAGLGRDVVHQLAMGDWLAVSVRDTGIGIPHERLPDVFEKFKRVADHSLLSELPQGTGLGLPICKEIIEQHGGCIGVDSQPGVGSTFSFILPLKSTFEIQKGLPFQSSNQGIATVHNLNSGVQLSPKSLGQKPLILIIEDEENIRNLLRQILTDAGYRVAEVADGTHAVTKARELHPDLVLSDVMIPGISGFDVLRVLKSDPETHHIPVVILSVVAEHQQRELHLEANAYLDKPVDAETLLQTVADLLSGGENESL
ncbi:MAG: response regulator, partial [Anaerolineae bacterium]|nr:response regulator [Anaerolineae bacterium]